jgi:3-oxoacyl-[acyl-carrier protein] reductase
MDLGLSGRRALVLASSQGLGAGVAMRLAMEGAQVAITGRSAERLAATAKSIEAASGIKPTQIVADLADPDAAARICDGALGGGNVDVLVNNTGGPPPGNASAVESQVSPRSLSSPLPICGVL